MVVHNIHGTHPWARRPTTYTYHNNNTHQQPQQQQQQQPQSHQPTQLSQLTPQEQAQIQQYKYMQQQVQPFQQGHFAVSNPNPIPATTDHISTAVAALAATQRTRNLNPMSSDTWTLNGQQTPRQPQTLGHQRDSSLSSVASNTPASPCNANTAHPHIAVPEAAGDGLHDMQGVADNNYTFARTKPMAMPGQFYGNTLGAFDGQSMGMNKMNSHGTTIGDMNLTESLPALTGAQHQRPGNMASATEMPARNSSRRSRPVSVASSVGEHEDEHRRVQNASATGAIIPKLDRTMTDIYNDELYSPNFTITSASPSPQNQLVLSPTNDLFNQRIQAANSQHLYPAHSPVSTESRGQSPFRQGSPYASVMNDFSKSDTKQSRQMSSQQHQGQMMAEGASQLLARLVRNSQQEQQQRPQQQHTPTTISPKDALLDFNEADADANFPLFPPQETETFGMSQHDSSGNMSRATTQQSASPFHLMSAPSTNSNFTFTMPSNVQMPQQFSFGPGQSSQSQQQQLTPTASTFSRMSSAEASNADGGSSSSIHDGFVARPENTSADSGTYTCTYHGCTQRFETPAHLQKHKREGHRQANALNHLRSPTSMGLPDSSAASSQAGPHKCSRINPSTGKPCNTVFSRPYDLTRHEDTIHNARKQKVRCELCTEDKTFSRADALTRHYRVVHPDLEPPGHKRRRPAN
ncbi:hypothetical protein F4808DRAFT_448159 [Astrocystis sublimbata]|nr:hypothetical protein F4808DRAFT_448159 [Astrocystis sublimbata]